jgi:hypothetical protein
MPVSDSAEEIWVLLPDQEADLTGDTYPLYFEATDSSPNNAATPPTLPDMSQLSGVELLRKMFGDPLPPSPDDELADPIMDEITEATRKADGGLWEPDYDIDQTEGGA